MRSFVPLWITKSAASWQKRIVKSRASDPTWGACRPFLKKRALAPFLASLVFATAASPCGFHNYAPQPTFVDRLLGSEQIVLARAASNNSFRFEVFQALEGDRDLSEIPFLVDSATRRRLALDANAAVLFARDGPYGPWQRLAFVDASMAPVLDFVMERLPDWEVGDDIDRFSYFASLIGHPDDRIHKLALRELDQADYSILRDISLEIEPARLALRLNDPTEYQLKPIRLLLLGLSGSDQVRGLLQEGLNDSVTAEGRYLGAFATALIELVGPAAVTDIAGSFLTDPAISLFTRELLIEALALHSQSGDEALEMAISETVANALWVDPDLAGAVARQFGTRGDWSHAAVLEMLVTEGSVRFSEDKQDVSQYLTFAKETEEQQ